MEEIWKVYKDSRNKYGGFIWEVSNLGRVKKNGELFIFKNIDEKHYYVICNQYVHRIIAELFIPNPENKPCVDHIDTNRHNNNVKNLRWVTYKENQNNKLTKKHIKESLLGITFSEEHKAKLREKAIGRKSATKDIYMWVNNGTLNKFIKISEYKKYIRLGFKDGKIRK